MEDDTPPKGKVSAQPPATLSKPRLSKPTTYAGGWGAVRSSLQHGQSEMGLVRTAKMLLSLNQQKGFDCPGCAWPDPEHRSSFEFCENGAKAVAEEATRKRVGPAFFAEHSIQALSGWSDYQLGRSGRLTHPMYLAPGAAHYVPVAWEDAFAAIGQRFCQVSSPDQSAFYTSGRTSNEAAFLYQLMVRKFGTNNLPDCSNMCHESTGKGLGAAIGIGKGTITLQDFDVADAIFIFGQNPGTNHPRMLSALRQAKKAGATIVSVNPLLEPGLARFKHPQKVTDMLGRGVALTDLYLQVRINGDLAILKALIKGVLEAEAAAPGTVLDHDFIRDKTVGLAALKADIAQHTWAALSAESGVSEADLRAASRIYAQSKATIICWAMGLTQHVNGVANIQSVVNLLLLKGNFGRPGAGACPVRGHSNVQGDRTMGIWEAPSEAFLDRLGEAMGFEPPRHHGLAVVPAIEAMHRGEVTHFLALGGNFLSAAPDTEYTAEALRRCAITVHISTKLNRSHLVTGREAWILPCLGRTELDEQAAGKQFVTVENSMGVVHRSRGSLPPASAELKSEPWIVAGLAKTLLPDDTSPWGEWVSDYDQIRDLIEASIPGFEDYNRRVRDCNGFSLPNGPREGRFTTPDGKAHFTVHPLPDLSLPEGHYWLMTTRTHDQYNTTIYGLDDRYRGIRGERRVVLMNPEDMAAAGFQSEEVVDITSHHQGTQRTGRRFLVIPYDLPRGCLGSFFPEANVLVPIKRFARISLTPSSKSIEVSLARAAPEAS
jgi:molybdopterin-dependent oxidoreductase alpha subunit